jgi:hypothetical protein
MRRCNCSGWQLTPLDTPPYAADFSHTYATFREEPYEESVAIADRICPQVWRFSMSHVSEFDRACAT